MFAHHTFTTLVGFSVTRFGENLSICQYSESLWAISTSLTIWQNFIPFLVNFYAFGWNPIVINGPILKNNLAIWSHWTWLSARSVVYRKIMNDSFYFLCVCHFFLDFFAFRLSSSVTRKNRRMSIKVAQKWFH